MKKRPPLILLIVLFSMTMHSKGNSMSVLQDKPLFKLIVNTFGTKHIININGVSIIKDMDSDGQSESTLPINHLMRSGRNTIDIYIYPDNPGEKINKHAKAALNLIVASNNDPNTKYSISNLTFEGALLGSSSPTSGSSNSGKLDSNNEFLYNKKGDVIIHDITVKKVPDYPGALIITRTVDIKSSLPLWSFFNSDDLPNYDSLNDEDYYKELEKLLIEYMKVQQAIKSNNIDPVIDLFEERNNELDLAFYQPSGTYKAKIKDSLKEAANDNGLELVELRKDNVNFTVEDNRKLASLTRNAFKAAISLNFKEGTGSQRYPLIFRYQNNKWILTR